MIFLNDKIDNPSDLNELLEVIINFIWMQKYLNKITKITNLNTPPPKKKKKTINDSRPTSYVLRHGIIK